MDTFCRRQDTYRL